MLYKMTNKKISQKYFIYFSSPRKVEGISLHVIEFILCSVKIISPINKLILFFETLRPNKNDFNNLTYAS